MEDVKVKGKMNKVCSDFELCKISKQRTGVYKNKQQ